MMEPRLQSKLGELESALRQARLWRRLALCWLAVAGVCLVLFVVHRLTGWDLRWIWRLAGIFGIVGAISIWRSERRRGADFKELADVLGDAHPESRHLLSTATEQQPDPETGGFHFLQRRVINEVLTHREHHLWVKDVWRKSSFAFGLQMAALVALIPVLIIADFFTGGQQGSAPWLGADVTVSPGDTKVERGTGLVISAQFSGRPPAEAMLVLISASGKTKHVPLERHLADPIFGASLLEVNEDGIYHVEYGKDKTKDYKITVFDYPALTRADAALRFPGYTGLTNKTIPDTLRVSAVEGTHLTYKLQLNKPVVRARLLPKNGAALNLTTQTNAIAMLDDLALTNSAKYSLELVDADGRTNKALTDFTIQVLTNRRPEVKMAFPRGDQRVSRLEELQLQAETRDDFGVVKYGIGYGIAGREPQFVELGGSTRADEKREFTNTVPLEKLGVDVDQVVSYFAWADDYGPDGQVRRTFSDMFFAEVRPFEEVFRADQSDEGGGGQGGGGGSQATKLAELQKQIVIATWKLQRDKLVPKAK
jgi:hypothetical protein